MSRQGGSHPASDVGCQGDSAWGAHLGRGLTPSVSQLTSRSDAMALIAAMQSRTFGSQLELRWNHPNKCDDVATECNHRRYAWGMSPMHCA